MMPHIPVIGREVVAPQARPGASAVESCDRTGHVTSVVEGAQVQRFASVRIDVVAVDGFAGTFSIRHEKRAF
ncbi:hypothetical protein Hesp01_60140 [Herbidospora sp. NBRC 101105]|nr:hypothetical protein Hesp01_60140 [Herbidospora sp. NBRC 101105]